MFGLFKKASPASVVAEMDLVFAEDTARADAVEKALRARKSGITLALLTPFRDHALALRELLGPRGIVLASLDATYRDAAPSDDAIFLLESARVPELLARTSGSLRCLQVERHPLRSHDDAVDAALAAHSTKHRVRRYLSLDDGLFQIFDAGGNVRKMFGAMGLESSEPIEDAMVSKAIARAQEKIAKKVRLEQPADSLTAWRAANLVK
jgi:hypothetical protein